MASVSLVVRDRILKDGTANVKVRITHKSVSDSKSFRREIPTDVYVKPTQFKSGRVVRHPKAQELNMALSTIKMHVEEIIASIKTPTKFLSIEQIMEHIEEASAPKVEKDEISFFEVLDEYIDRLNTNVRNKAGIRKENRTAQIYQWTRETLWEYAQTDIRFSEITPQFLEALFNNLSSLGNSVNTISIHMRNIRAIFNKAYEWDYLEYGKHYPFRKYKIKREETDYRDMSLEELRKFIQYQATDVRRQTAKDFFLINFMLVGINVIDLVYLTDDDIKKGRLKYTRSKTGRKYTLKIHERLKPLLEQYKGETHLLRFIELSNDHKYITKTQNKWLKKIGEELEIGPITTYWARYTWANIARNVCRLPMDDIRRALGHGQKTTTDIYVNEDYRIIDEANEKVIGTVFDGQ